MQHFLTSLYILYKDFDHLSSPKHSNLMNTMNEWNLNAILSRTIVFI